MKRQLLGKASIQSHPLVRAQQKELDLKIIYEFFMFNSRCDPILMATICSIILSVKQFALVTKFFISSRPLSEPRLFPTSAEQSKNVAFQFWKSNEKSCDDFFISKISFKLLHQGALPAVGPNRSTTCRWQISLNSPQLLKASIWSISMSDVTTTFFRNETPGAPQALWVGAFCCWKLYSISVDEKANP